jgi:flagellar biosynthesis/type III secretory pathway protein FliH
MPVIKNQRYKLTPRPLNFKVLVDALDRPFQRQELKVSEYLLSLVASICKSILRRELSIDVEHISKTLDSALELLSGERAQVTVLLHPDDAGCRRECLGRGLGGA